MIKRVPHNWPFVRGSITNQWIPSQKAHNVFLLMGLTLLNKQSKCLWFGTPWHLCDATIMWSRHTVYPKKYAHGFCFAVLTIAPVPAKQPWWIWINTWCELIMNDCITTTKQSTTKPCAYFLGYTGWLMVAALMKYISVRLRKHIIEHNKFAFPVLHHPLGFQVLIHNFRFTPF